MGLPGNAEKAENSFFKISTKGATAGRHRGTAPAQSQAPGAVPHVQCAPAWAIVTGRASPQMPAKDRNAGQEIHETLFRPELTSPVKTLELPLGGSTGDPHRVRSAQRYMLTADRDQLGNPKKACESGGGHRWHGDSARLRMPCGWLISYGKRQRQSPDCTRRSISTGRGGEASRSGVSRNSYAHRPKTGEQ